MQLYFLSVVLNAAAGYILFTDDKREPAAEQTFAPNPANPVFRLILGIVTMIMGVLSILASTDIPVVGDIFPALAGLGSGFALVFGYYRSKSTIASEKADKTGKAIELYKKPLGIVTMVIAFLHFLLPSVLLI
jgi:uncharacterized membrane-anchored protein